jgi:hypothetical protein
LDIVQSSRTAPIAALTDWRAALAGFIDRTNRVLALIEGFMPEAEWLDDPETLRTRGKINASI